MHFSGKEKRAQRLDSLLFTGGPILIHALRMERDKDILEMLGYQFYFNSRTRVRCDIWIAKAIAFAKFRFAHPYRVRPGTYHTQMALFRF